MKVEKRVVQEGCVKEFTEGALLGGPMRVMISAGWLDVMAAGRTDR